MNEERKVHHSDVNQEIYYGIKKRERLAWGVAFFSLLIGIISSVTIMLITPLKEVQAYPIIIDKATGQVDYQTVLDAQSVTREEAVIESLLFNYVRDRETMDKYDHQLRMEKVLRMSEGQANTSIYELWDKNSPKYILNQIAETTRMLVTIKTIVLEDGQIAKIQLKKRIIDGGNETVKNYLVTLQYDFNITRKNNQRLVWENPLGFQVINYRLEEELEN